MKPFSVHRGTMAPLPLSNIDTDQIIPKQFLTRIERSGFGPHLFYDWATDPDFVLNRPEYAQASILVTGPNFGSGSSREHAPWALEDWGFRVIVAPSFADIFTTNCHKIGLLPVTLPASAVAYLTELASTEPAAVATVDLDEQVIEAGTRSFRFEIHPHTKWCLMEGLDEIARTLEHVGAIEAFEARRPAHRPVVSS